MAISTSNILPLLAFITASLVLLHGAQSIRFNFPHFNESSASELIIQGDATIAPSPGVLQLTRVDTKGNPLGGSVGRVLYNTPVPLRIDKEKYYELYAFTTSFSFRIGTPGVPADGITFFLASPESTIPPGSGGALLGLFSNANALNNSRNEVMDFKLTASDRVVAVEFDTYVNENLGDPNFRHIGVDVNSIRSNITRRWDWVNNDRVDVTISYNPFNDELSIVATHCSGPRVEFSYEIDLTSILPYTVRVGLSASTGYYSQVNTIESWSFMTSEDEEAGYIASVV